MLCIVIINSYREEKANMTNKKIRVFLSRPNPFTENQNLFIKELIKFLRRHNIECVTLQAAEYTPYEVMNSLSEMIQRSYGIIIVAFGQTFVSSGTRKMGAEDNPDFFASKETHLKNKWVTSVYCHIEGILALTYNLPMLSIPQENLTEEGILKKGEYSITSPEFSLETKENILMYLQSEGFQKSFHAWKNLLDDKYNFIKGGEINY